MMKIAFWRESVPWCKFYLNSYQSFFSKRLYEKGFPGEPVITKGKRTKQQRNQFKAIQ